MQYIRIVQDNQPTSNTLLSHFNNRPVPVNGTVQIYTIPDVYADLTDIQRKAIHNVLTVIQTVSDPRNTHISLKLSMIKVLREMSSTWSNLYPTSNDRVCIGLSDAKSLVEALLDNLLPM